MCRSGVVSAQLSFIGTTRPLYPEIYHVRTGQFRNFRCGATVLRLPYNHFLTGKNVPVVTIDLVDVS
jgi:hypothetical protein